MGYQITDNLTFSNRILSETLSMDDKREMIEETIKILSIISKNYFCVNNPGNEDLFVPNIESLKAWCECIESKLDLVGKWEDKEFDSTPVEETEEYATKKKEHDENMLKKDKTTGLIGYKLEIILAQLNMMLEMYNTDCPTRQDSNRRNICFAIMETDIVNNIAHILSGLQIKGQYQDNGDERYVANDIFSVKDMKMERLVKLKYATIVRDIKSDKGHKYAMVVDLPNADVKFKWHMPNMLATDFLLNYGKEVILPDNDMGKDDRDQIAYDWKIPETQVRFEAPDKFVFDAPESIYTNKSNMIQIRGIHKYFFSKLQNKVEGNRRNEGPSSPGD